MSVPNKTANNQAAEQTKVTPLGTARQSAKRSHNYPKNRKSSDRVRTALSPRKNAAPPVKETAEGKKTTQLLLAVTLAHQGLTNNRIAQDLGVNPRTVSRLLRKGRDLLLRLRNIDAYRQSRSDLFETVEQLSIESVAGRLAANDPEDRLRDRAYTLDVLHKSGRLERNLSTQNVENRHTFTRCNLSEVPGEGQLKVIEDQNDR